MHTFAGMCSGASPDQWRDSMKDMLYEVLQGSSEPEAWQIFEEILEGERRQMVVAGNE